MKFSELSVEVGHFYISDLHKESERGGNVERLIHQSMDAGMVAVTPIVKRYLDRKKPVSMTVLIDDYFLPEDSKLDRNDVAVILREYNSRADLDPDLHLDHIVFESALAESVEMMLRNLMRPPRLGDGSSEGEGQHKEAWLSNGQTGRHQPSGAHSSALDMALESKRSQKTYSSGSKHPHSLSIDVEMYQERRSSMPKWACPTLAAWWQLIRLGMLRDDEDAPYYPEGTIVLNQHRSLFAKRTLTALSPKFLEIEAAVRTILSQVSIPSMWLKELRIGEDLPKQDEHLRRMSHIFVYEGFHPHGLETLSSWT